MARDSGDAALCRTRRHVSRLSRLETRNPRRHSTFPLPALATLLLSTVCLRHAPASSRPSPPSSQDSPTACAAHVPPVSPASSTVPSTPAVLERGARSRRRPSQQRLARGGRTPRPLAFSPPRRPGPVFERDALNPAAPKSTPSSLQRLTSSPQPRHARRRVRFEGGTRVEYAMRGVIEANAGRVYYALVNIFFLQHSDPAPPLLSQASHVRI
ncbi:hypothetical protein B0H12DRAFT_1244419 [Mycena haematopus]|nr:hypothetical protein B0H12DRAFT_1244419 [Mycena haematopus]